MPKQPPRQPSGDSVLDGPLIKHEPEEWHLNARKLTRPVREFQCTHGDISRGMTVDYEIWIRIIYKYAEALHLRVSVRQDRNDARRYHLYLGGVSLADRLLPDHKPRWLQLDLNESLTRGVISLVNDQFRHMFGVEDDDKTFFRLYHRQTL